MGRKILKEALITIHLGSGSDITNTVIYRGGRPRIKEAIRFGEVIAQVVKVDREKNPIAVEMNEIKISQVEPKQYHSGTSMRRFNLI